MKECSFEGCTKRVSCKGLCTGHYQQHHKGLTLKPLRSLDSAQYTEDGLKICRTCREAKDKTTGFYSMSGNNCRTCHNAQAKQWREKNTDHFARIQREWREANEGHVYTDKKSGYQIYIGYNHPAALACGVTRYHRIVLWEKIGGGEHPCNWCGKTVYWNQSTHTDWHTALIVDHVDWDKTNNNPLNLVPACNDCNLSTKRRRNFGKMEEGENNETN